MDDQLAIVTYKQAREEFERGYWAALIQAHASVSAAAKAAGINRTQLHRRLRRFKVEYALSGQGKRGAHRGNWGELSN